MDRPKSWGVLAAIAVATFVVVVAAIQIGYDLLR